MVLTCRDVTERLANDIAAGTRVTHVRYAFDLAQSALDLGASEFLRRLPKVCHEMAAMLDADMVYVDRLDSDGRCLVNLAWCTRGAARPAIAVGEAVSFDDIPNWVEVLRHPAPVVEPDLLEAAHPWVLDKRRHLGGERSLMAMG